MPAFIDDLRPQDSLAGAVVRSPFTRGLLRELAMPDLPEGCFGLSAADIPGDPILECRELRVPALAAERVLHPGQPLALLGAADAEQAAELAAAVRLAVDPEPPLAGLSGEGPRPADAGWSWHRGATAEAFAGAAHIVEGEYRYESLPPGAVDPVGAVAEWDGRVLLLHALTADPFDLRRQLARLLDLPERRVRVRAAASGPLEGRLLPALLAAAHAALLAWRSGRSVRLIYDPLEQALWASGSLQAVVRLRTALDPSGAPIGAQVSLELDGGAFPPADQGGLEEAVRSGEPACPNLELAADWMESSRPPADPLPAREAAWFAAELHASRLQVVARLDPYEWRRRLAGRLRAAEKEALEQVVALADFRRRYAACAAARSRRGPGRSLRGIGLALCSQEDCTLGAMRLVLEKDGTLSVLTALASAEPWLAELFRRQAARLLELEPGSIRVQPSDTRDLPPGSGGSVGGALGPGLRLLELCCRDLRRRGRPATVTRRAAGGRTERSWAAAVVEVEADPATLELRCRSLWLVLDVGRVEDERLYRDFAAGEALRALERIAPSRRPWAREPLRGFHPVSASTPRGLPELHVHFLQRGGRAGYRTSGPEYRTSGAGYSTSGLEHRTSGPGYRSWERLPSLGIAPAFAAAASQATGLFLDRLPLSPEVIQQCLQSE
jgi:CO/xanthine dehydrogenase Mo-binding subunit